MERSTEFLGQFTERSREPAYALRSLLPTLEQQEIMPQKMDISTSQAEFLAIQTAILKSLRPDKEEQKEDNAETGLEEILSKISISASKSSTIKQDEVDRLARQFKHFSIEDIV